jgi:hypothetical protein
MQSTCVCVHLDVCCTVISEIDDLLFMIAVSMFPELALLISRVKYSEKLLVLFIALSNNLTDPQLYYS